MSREKYNTHITAATGEIYYANKRESCLIGLRRVIQFTQQVYYAGGV
jgi:hypothetical protein